MPFTTEKARRSRSQRAMAPGHTPLVALLLACGICAAPEARALEIETGNPDLKIRWDNTLKYSNAFRLKAPSAALTGDLNNDDGNRNFGRGLISNRVDWLSEFDVLYQNFGARVSAAAWYDTVYNRRNDNGSPGTVNAYTAAPDRFTQEARELHGRRAELLDAYVFGKFDLDGRQVTVRAGKHTLLYGESLFFGANGIAGAQAPVDVIKATSVPGAQVKEVLRPVNQISTQIQLNPQVSMGAYYQLAWESLRLPAVGSYFSTQDLVGAGTERILLGPTALYHANDIGARDSGQGGIQLRLKPRGSDTEYGLYALRFHSKAPWLLAYPGEGAGTRPGQIGTYRLVYPESIRLYGTSFSTTVGDAGVAGEFSVRHNNPLTSQDAVTIGKTAHAQVSVLYAMGRTALWDSASLAGEVAWNRILSVQQNAANLDPSAERDAWGFRVLLEPSWYQVLPAVDLSMPINIGYSPRGRSAVAGVGIDKGGDITVGLNAEYAKQWKFALAYTHYFGQARTFLVTGPAGGYVNSFKQAMRDRDFISFSVQRSF